MSDNTRVCSPVHVMHQFDVEGFDALAELALDLRWSWNDAANYPAHCGITSELYGGGPESRLQQELVLGGQLVGAENGYAYSVRVPATRPAEDFTARVTPFIRCVAVPLEESRILWQR